MNKIILSLSGIAVVCIGSYLYFSNFNNENIIVQNKEILQKKEKTPRITTTYVKYIKPIKKKENGLEIVRGYKLPPEPDPKINNSTLLGVDSNNNMLRDDVERWIVQHDNWSDRQIAGALQKARGLQLILNEDMGDNIRKSTLKNMDGDACDSIWQQELHRKLTLKENLKNLYIFTRKIFNTKERKKEYKKYKMSFSGTIINGFPGSGEFSYKYADYTMEDGTLSSYEFTGKDRYYNNTKIPLYSSKDGLIGSYWNLEKNEPEDFDGNWNDKFCEINFGIPENNIECARAKRKYRKNLKNGVVK